MKPYNPPKKGIGEQLKEDLFFVIIASVIFYFIVEFFKLLFWPLQYAFMSNWEIEREEEKKADKKKEAREERAKLLTEDPFDPMNCYLDQVSDPEKYNDGTCVEWYRRWKKGEIIDSELKWAPPVYNKNGTLKVGFLDYFNIQIYLHRHFASWSGRRNFLLTIRKFYPEISANFNRMSRDIENLRDKSTKEKLEKELLSEIRKIGVPKEYADDLIKADLSGNEIRKKAKIIKKCLENEFNGTAIDTILQNGVDPDSGEAHILNEITKNGMSGNVALAFAVGDIDVKELDDLVDTAITVIDLHGLGVYGEPSDTEGARNMSCLETLMGHFLKDAIKNKKKRRREEETSKVVWGN